MVKLNVYAGHKKILALLLAHLRLKFKLVFLIIFKGIGLNFVQMQSHNFLQGDDSIMIGNTQKIFFSKQWGHFQLNLAQSIIGWREFCPILQQLSSHLHTLRYSDVVPAHYCIVWRGPSPREMIDTLIIKSLSQFYVNLTQSVLGSKLLKIKTLV